MAVNRTDHREGPLTVEEFERLPEEDAYRIELVRGLVVCEPRPAAEHGRILVNFSALLRDHIRRHELGHAFADTGVILSTEPATVRGPDLAFVAAARLPSGPPRRGFLEFAPDLCVEIVSPSNSAAEIQEKVLEYLDAGTRLVWVVHPETRTVTEYRSRREIRIIGEADELDGADVVSGFRVPVAELFAP